MCIPLLWSHLTLLPGFLWWHSEKSLADLRYPHGPLFLQPAVTGWLSLKRQSQMRQCELWLHHLNKGRQSEVYKRNNRFYSHVYSSKTNTLNINLQTERLWRMMCSCEGGEELVKVTVLLLDKLRGRPWLVERLSGSPWLDVVWR